MKKLIVSLTIIIAMMNCVSRAQVPKKISYQGLLTTSMGTPAANGMYTLQFDLYDVPSGGSSLWTETDTSVSVQQGTFSVILGSTTAINLPFDEAYYLEVTAIAGPGISSPVTFSPRSEFTSAPYSLRADTAEYAKVAPGGGGGPYLPLAGGTMTGAITSTGNPPITMGKGNFGSGNVNTGINALASGENDTANGDYSVVSGGRNNKATASSSTVSGGSGNSANGLSSTVGGGGGNTANEFYSTVSGGNLNSATGNGSTVSGGSQNYARGDLSVVAGGGGFFFGDSNSALGWWSTIGGGRSNIAGPDIYTTVSGGGLNVASGLASFVGGGRVNRARGQYAVVAGGGGGTDADSNSAIGDYSTIPGGRANKASGNYSFAAGWNAKANHTGTFVWADSTGPFGADFASTGTNQFLIRASGGVGIGTNSPAAPLEIHYDNALDSKPAIIVDNNGPSGQDVLDFKFSGVTEARLRKSRTYDLFLGTVVNDGLSFQTNAATRMRMTETGNVGIGTINAQNKLDVEGGAVIGATYSGTNTAPANGLLVEGNVGIGTSLPQSMLHVEGYSKLGSDAPAIKVKKLAGTTASTEGGTVSIAHGVTESKIIAITVMVEFGLNSYVHPGYTNNPEYQFNWYTSAGSVIVWNTSGNSGNILSKPIKILITYEE